MQSARWFHFAVLTVFLIPTATADVVINEIHYHPANDGPYEFIELHNTSNEIVSLEGYRFTDGVLYEFSARDRIAANGYFVLFANPNLSVWSTVGSRKAGPFIGKLSNSGEQLVLRNASGEIVDEVTWTDQPPWTNGADGYSEVAETHINYYGLTLERVDPLIPGSDWKNWRTSLSDNGTVGAENDAAALRNTPVVIDWEVNPTVPTSGSEAVVTLTLESETPIERVFLYYQPFTSAAGDRSQLAMTQIGHSGTEYRFQASIPPHDSQTLVRLKWGARLEDSRMIYLPHRSEPRPFESYFVYDNDVESLLPIAWIFDRRTVNLPEATATFTGGVFKPVGEPLRVFDGAFVFSSRNGKKIRFIKSEEYQGNRTLNILPETPTGSTTSGVQTPFVEHISFEIFRTFGIMAPGAEWYRIYENGRPSQRLLIQQPNEMFIEMNGRDRTSDVFKIAYNAPERTRLWNPIGYEKKTNLDEDDSNLDTLVERIYASDPTTAAQNVYRYLDVEKVLMYSVAGCLMSNWDGFFNNMFIYYNPPPIGQWEPIPWDCDKTFGYTDGNSMFVEMPLDYPLNGNAPRAGRPPGLISQPFHSVPELHAEYKRWVRHELDYRFSIDTVEALASQYEGLLLDDVDLIDHSQYNKTTRRRNITRSYDTIREFTDRRHDFLRQRLPVSVEEWALMD